MTFLSFITACVFVPNERVIRYCKWSGAGLLHKIFHVVVSELILSAPVLEAVSAATILEVVRVPADDPYLFSSCVHAQYSSAHQALLATLCESVCYFDLTLCLSAGGREPCSRSKAPVLLSIFPRGCVTTSSHPQWIHITVSPKETVKTSFS
jgi:hypothetical protein